jgi:hypothetical protein
MQMKADIVLADRESQISVFVSLPVHFPLLSGVDFQGLYHIAERLKDNYAERKAWFPDFKDSDLIIGDDVWISAQPPSAQSPATHCHEWVCRDLRQGCCRQNTSELAGSPDEENPPSSVTPSEATGKLTTSPPAQCIYML